MRIMLLESLIYIGVNINLEAEFMQEVQNVLQVEIGILENDLNIAKMDFENLSKGQQESVYNFYESLVSLETAMERSLDDEMVLAKYIEYEKLAVKKSEMIKKQNAKYKN